MSEQTSELRKKNIVVALLLAAFALLVFFTSIPFWTGIFRIVGNQAGG
ncbi:MAG: hypothetical protein GY703_12455 [Gammaproteobacteria bacterium]|nr:hypothetical protein [Gammaproteobacteria bacterium]